MMAIVVWGKMVHLIHDHNLRSCKLDVLQIFEACVWFTIVIMVHHTFLALHFTRHRLNFLLNSTSMCVFFFNFCSLHFLENYKLAKIRPVKLRPKPNDLRANFHLPNQTFGTNTASLKC